MGKIDHRCALGLRTLFLDLVLALILLLATFAPVVAREFYLFKSRIVLFYYVQVFKKNIELAD